MTQIKQTNGMVDVGDKQASQRMATASSTLHLGEKAYNILINEGSPKGDVFEAAKIAGVMAAKQTPSLIPMCHPLELAKVSVTFNCDAKNYTVESIAEAKYVGKTGVEMEALVAASTASLTIYDMMKWADKGMSIQRTELISKSGGKTGDYQR